MHTLIVVLDGAGDRPCRELRGRTPLQAARLPALNALARRGTVGLARVAGNISPESDTGVFAVLGTNPLRHHAGRGALEALGAGERMTPETLSFRANFATADASGRNLLDRRAGRSLSTHDARTLALTLTQHVRLPGTTARFTATTGHRGVLLLESHTKLSKAVSNTDPAYTLRHGIGHARPTFPNRVLDAKPLNRTPAARRAAALVNAFTRQAHALLDAHPVNARRRKKHQPPANAVLLRDAELGLRAPPTRAFRNWAALADMPLEKGIGAYLGMKVIPLPANPPTPREYRLRAGLAWAALHKHAGVYVHLKGPDAFGHDGDARGKTRSLEQIDAAFFHPLLQRLDPQTTRVLVTADHATPCPLRAHSADPVPYLLAGPRVPARGLAFNERDARKGPREKTHALLAKLLKT